MTAYLHLHYVTLPTTTCYHYFVLASDVETDGVYLWELENLGKYFPSEGKGIENIMSALSVAGKDDKHGDSRARYNVLVGDQECILANIRRKPGQTEPTVAYIRAGPRPVLHFNPATVNAAIVTCGGLCPGLNNVVREITRALYHLYGIKGNVYGIVGGFKELEAVKAVAGVLQSFPQLVPNSHGQVLRRGHATLHKRHVQVDIRMVQRFNDPVFDDFFEPFEVDHKAGIRIHFTGHGDPKFKIMPVPMLVGAFAKDLFVACLVPLGIPQFVSGVEMSFAGNKNHRRPKIQRLNFGQ